MNKSLSILLLVLLPLGLIGLMAYRYFESDQIANQQTSANQSTNSEPAFPSGVTLKAWNTVDDFNKNMVQFETVFWDPRDTISLRKLIQESGLVKDKTIMEIGCGTGLIGLCCLKAGANKAIVTDINPTAVANAKYNSKWLGFKDKLEVRQVALEKSSAFSTLKAEEKFDLIISNPPWVNQKPKSIDEFALYDENFDLMRTLFDGMKERLNPGGRVWLAYGCVDAIKTMEKMADERGFGFEILDDRNLDDLNEEFLPGMLIEIKPF